MALPLFPQEENSIDKLSRSLNTGLGNGIQTLAQSNLERMLGRNNYFQQNIAQALSNLDSSSQKLPVQQDSLGLTNLQVQKPQQNESIKNTILGNDNNKSILSKKEIQNQKKIQDQQEKEQKRLQSEQEKLKKLQIKEQRQEQNFIDKETYPFYKETLKSEKAATENDLRLDRMQELVEKGSLPISHFYKLFKNLSESDIGKSIPIVGPLLSILVNPILRFAGGTLTGIQKSITSRDTEEFEKLSNDFLKNVKDIFGARVTQGEVERYLKTIPTLEQTDNGKLSLIRNLKSFNKITELRSRVMKDIIKENNGYRPRNLEILVDERMDPILDEIALEFKMGTKAYPSL